MKQKELVYKEILYQVMEKNNRKLTQAELARRVSISLSTVNLALKTLRRIGSVRVRSRGFDVVNPRKILLYWASIRNLESDIIYSTRANKSAAETEKSMPGGVVFTGYSAYKFMFKDVPADYSEVYVYSNDMKEIKKRFPENKNPPNLFVLKGEGEISLAQLFVDLWNMKEWYAKDFLNGLEARIDGLLA